MKHTTINGMSVTLCAVFAALTGRGDVPADAGWSVDDSKVITEVMTAKEGKSE